MKRFFLFFLFYTICSFSFGQNLIPNPSAEDYIECPSSLGPVDAFVESWINMRGSVDYFHSCCTLPELCWNNSLGYQEPKSGEGYIGAVQFHQNLENAREYMGVKLLDSLTIGETYTVSFFVSMAFKINNADRAIDKLGFLLMTANYLDSDGQGVVQNHSSYSVNSIINDTTNWVDISATFVADSAYKFIAFGNFYDDENTTVELKIPDGIAMISYYYFDDFCLSLGNECDFANSIATTENVNFKLFPNPTNNELNVESSFKIQTFQIYSAQGELLMNEFINNKFELKIELNFEPGIYITKIKTEKGLFAKRFMVQY